MSASSQDIETLRSTVWAYYKKHGRHDLPWRNTVDPYHILVSETMLQQTQVVRVVPKYIEFLKIFPTIRALASAPLCKVLIAWQGLGYNRRGKMLHDAAIVIQKTYGGVVPRTIEELMRLPGVGPYTARAVCVFAYGQDGGMVETNIRTVLFHHLFVHRSEVSDAELLQVTTVLCPQGRAREWYAALMDYGAHLKEQGVRLNMKSKHYTMQSKFEGSDRQIRGVILRILTGEGETSEHTILQKVGTTPNRVQRQLENLVRESIIKTTQGAKGSYLL